MEFKLEKAEIGGKPLLRLSGMVMDAEVYRFSREIKNLTKEGHPTIIVDVTACEFMDSHALGLLVYHHTALSKEGRRLILVNETSDPMAYMRVLLESTGLTQLFTVVTSQEGL